MTSSESVVGFRRRRKANLIAIKGGKCCVCGFDQFQEAQEFHHVDPKEKKFGLGNGSCHSLSECIAEVRKCALVCSNCHAGVHARYCFIPCGWDYIDEEKVKALLDEQEKKVHKCELCGKEIRQSSKHCKLCSSRQMRKLERPSREQLKDLIRKMSFFRNRETIRGQRQSNHEMV